jgi:uncharacterized SAM-binding protein YcdF (DUF218 family)
VIELLKEALLPGSVTFMIGLLLGGIVLLYLRPRWGRIVLTVAALVYAMLTTPAGAALLAWTTNARYAPLGTAADARNATVIVLLGAGSNNVRAFGLQLSVVNRVGGLRALEAARVYHLLGDPIVIVSGGVTDPIQGAAPESEAYRSALVALGIPAARIMAESESLNTHDEAVILKPLLVSLHAERFVLVTSPLHMARAVATFAAQGLHPIPSPTPLYADRARAPFPLLPNDGAFETSGAAIYEWLARPYYWVRGWTRPAAPAE